MGLTAAALEPPALPSRASKGARLAVARWLVPVVLGWLRERDQAAMAGDLEAMPAVWRRELTHLLTVQGLAPLVADVATGGAPTGDPTRPASPPTASTADYGADQAGAAAPGLSADATEAWLARQLEQNRARMRAFAEDLEAVLAGAAAQGVPVMPLKGALLAFTRYREPGLRPMADLDLLVRQEDEPAMHSVLTDLGYRLLDPSDVRHRAFRRPGDAVVARDSTHPGNPRKVEVHTRIVLSAWLYDRGVDLAPALWASAREGSLRGRQVVLPSATSFLTHVAANASLDLMHGSGRLLSFFDLALAAEGAGSLDERFSIWAYPALALAARSLRTESLCAKERELAAHVYPALRRAAERIPLDDRAGLDLLRMSPRDMTWLQARWRRWHPNPWLVHAAFPGWPAPLAYPAYVGGVGTRAISKAVRSLRFSRLAGQDGRASSPASRGGG